MKSNKHNFIIILVFFVIFNVLAFVIPSGFTSSFWIAYVFSVIAFLFGGYIWFDFIKKDHKAMSRFYKIPLIYVVYWYLTIQLITFFAFKLIAAIPSWIVIVIDVILFGLSIIGCITIDEEKDYIEKIDNKVKKKIYFIKELLVDVELMEASEKDDEVKKELHVLTEKIKFSNPMSVDELEALENKIRDSVALLKEGDSEHKKDAISSILILL